MMCLPIDCMQDHSLWKASGQRYFATSDRDEDSPDESMNTLPPPETGDRDEDFPDPAESDNTEEPMDISP